MGKESESTKQIRKNNLHKEIYMSRFKTLVLSVFVVAVSFWAAESFAGSVETSTTGVQGYDLVSYHTDGKPVKGSGAFVAEHEGVTYLFASEENQKAFQANPDKYLPAYGGYCAYGVAVNKKFVGDPEVWEIVDDRLYLNLNPEIQTKWQEDTKGHIATGDQNWPGIKDKAPAEL